jgi:hypothetical protein
VAFGVDRGDRRRAHGCAYRALFLDGLEVGAGTDYSPANWKIVLTFFQSTGK